MKARKSAYVLKVQLFEKGNGLEKRRVKAEKAAEEMNQVELNKFLSTFYDLYTHHKAMFVSIRTRSFALKLHVIC